MFRKLDFVSCRLWRSKYCATAKKPVSTDKTSGNARIENSGRSWFACANSDKRLGIIKNGVIARGRGWRNRCLIRVQWLEIYWAGDCPIICRSVKKTDNVAGRLHCPLVSLTRRTIRSIAQEHNAAQISLRGTSETKGICLKEALSA